MELFEGIFCLVDELATAPRPKVRILPVCPLQLSCIWWEASTYQMILDREAAERDNGKRRVVVKYLSNRLSLPQSSSAGDLTRVVRKATVVWISRRTHERKSSCAVV